jgi:hypothetical protein
MKYKMIFISLIFFLSLGTSAQNIKIPLTTGYGSSGLHHLERGMIFNVDASRYKGLDTSGYAHWAIGYFKFNLDIYLKKK